MPILERRLEELQQLPLFTVVDKDDHPLFAISPGAATVYYPTTGAPAVTMRARAEGGTITAQAANESQRFTVAVSPLRSGLTVEKDGVIRADLGSGATGSHSLRIFTAESRLVAGIGESRAGSGAIVVQNRDGKPALSMRVTDGKGDLDVFNPNGTAVLSLTEGASGGGLLAICGPDGTTMVKMGVKDNRYGVVLTGPGAGFPLVPRSGLPGSYFMGCAAGPACVP